MERGGGGEVGKESGSLVNRRSESFFLCLYFGRDCLLTLNYGFLVACNIDVLGSGARR